MSVRFTKAVSNSTARNVWLPSSYLAVDHGTSRKRVTSTLQTRSTSRPVMSIDARLKAVQSPACPNPSREAKRRRDRKHQKGLCVVFHAVLQHTLRPQDRRRALDTACTNATDENSNGCLSRSFANIKELSATFVPMCHVGNTAMWTRSGNGAIAGSKSLFFYFRNLSSLIFRGASLNVLGPRRDNT